MIKQTNISHKNDLLRTTMFNFLGRIVLTDTVANSCDRELIISAVRNFNNFNPENDPYGEHDFGKIRVNNQYYFFKIDYYDSTYTFFQEDGHRVLTIMAAWEY